MNYLPPLRNHQQMVRIVQNGSGQNGIHHSHTNFSVGNAFGGDSNMLFGHDSTSPTEQIIRTLDSMNLPSSSPRRAGEIKEGGLYPTRTSSSLFHDLNDTGQNYLNGVGQQVTSRREAGAGTKLRTELTPHATNKMRHRDFSSHTPNQTDHRESHHTHHYVRPQNNHRASASHTTHHSI